jgi:glycosyltransferase involved in cell wall biosynthesis
MEGIARYIYEISSRMAMTHPEDTFYYLFDRKYHDSFITSKNIVPLVIPPPTRHPILWNIWFQHIIPHVLKRKKIDVFYTGESYMSRRSTIPTAIVTHDLAYCHYPEQIPDPVLRYYKKYFPQNHKQADKIITVSEFSKEDIAKQYTINKEEISVVYNACPDHFVPVDSSEKKNIQEEHADAKPYFVYLGSIHPRKNVARMIAAFETFKKNTGSDYKLLLIGRWAWKTSEVKKQIENSPYRSDIIIKDYTREVVYKIVASSEALLYCSLFEGFGIPILEGFSAGVPVITSTVSSMPEVARDAALLVDPTEVNSIAEGMLQISKDNNLREKLIQKGNERLQDFSWDNSAAKTYEILIGLANSK